MILARLLMIKMLYKYNLIKILFFLSWLAVLYIF